MTHANSQRDRLIDDRDPEERPGITVGLGSGLGTLGSILMWRGITWSVVILTAFF